MKIMLRKSRHGMVLFIALATVLLLLQFVLSRIWTASIERQQCTAKRKWYATTVQNERVYPRTIGEMTADFYGTRCRAEESDLFEVSKPVYNRVLQNSRFLLEPSNAERYCDENTFLVLFILSQPADFETRRAVRESWANARNTYQPNLVQALPEAFRNAFDNSEVRNRFGVRTFFILGTDEQVAEINYGKFSDNNGTKKKQISLDGQDNTHDRKDHSSRWKRHSEAFWKNQQYLSRKSVAAPRMSVASRLSIAKQRLSRNSAFRIERGVWPSPDKESPINKRLREESAQFNDIVQASFIDSYANLTLKVLLATKWIAARCSSARFAMKIDTDTIPNLPGLIGSLIQRDLKESTAVFDLPSFYSTRNAQQYASESERVFRDYLFKFRTAKLTKPAKDDVRIKMRPTSPCSSFYNSQMQYDTEEPDRLVHDATPYQLPTARENHTAVSTEDDTGLHHDDLVGRETASIGEQQCAALESEFYLAHYGPMMIGYRYEETKVSRSGRWGVEYSSFPVSNYPQYLAGTAYVLSMTAVQEVYQLALHYRYMFNIEDAFVTGVLGTLIRARQFEDWRFSPYNSWKPSVCQFVKGYRLTATNFELEELIAFWQDAITAQC